MEFKKAIRGLVIFTVAFLLLALTATLALADTLVLSPNAPGILTELDVSGAPTNWEACTSDDGDSSFVYNTGAIWKTDLYNLDDSSANISSSTIINSVTVYIKARKTGLDVGYATTVITGTVGNVISLTGLWEVYSTTYITNPSTLLSWTKADIDALQAGVALRYATMHDAGDSRCTRVWVEVDYNAPASQTPTATGSGTVTLAPSVGTIEALTAIAEGTLSTAGRPEGVNFPDGLFSFNIIDITLGATVAVTITLPQVVPINTQYWEYLNGVWVNRTLLLNSNDGDNVLTLTLTDGGLGDADGVANGTIVNLGGPAVPVSPTTATMKIGQKTYTVGGTTYTMDVAPYIKNSRTYVPVRYLAYSLGITSGNIGWDSATQTVTLTKGSDTVTLVIGSTTLDKNGVTTTMDVAPEITSGRTMLPARWVAEAFGATVSWDAGNQTVSIVYL